MRPVICAPDGRSFRAVAMTLAVALTIASGAASPAGSAADRRAPRARGADACAGKASLRVSDLRPRQLRAVRFSAAASTVPAPAVVFYDFRYGDGSDDATAQPTAVHAYQQAGTYLAKVSIVTACGAVISSAEYRVVVADGVPPTATISSPRPNQLVHFGRTGLLLSGSAHDRSGVRRVELAIEILSVKRARVRAAAGAAAAGKTPPAGAGPACYWYDGQLTLRPRSCATPLFFRVALTGSSWSFRMNPRSRIPPGLYVARVRAIDRAGNLTSLFSVSLGDIVAFTLVA